MPASEASSSRALNAILPLVATGQPYEAHQKARTFASRYSKSGQYDTAIDVLFQSARELLKSGQQGSGTDLALFLLDVYENKGESVSDESRGPPFPTVGVSDLTDRISRQGHAADRAHGSFGVMAKDDHRESGRVCHAVCSRIFHVLTRFD